MQKYCGCHTEQLLTRYEKRGISRNATPAPRNEVTQRMKSPKVTAFAALLIGTAIRTSSERQGAAADGCERLRTVAKVGATSRTQPPNLRVKREPLLCVREKTSVCKKTSCKSKNCSEKACHKEKQALCAKKYCKNMSVCKSCFV